MHFNTVNVHNALSPVDKQGIHASDNGNQDISFAELIKTALNQVNDAQIASDNKTIAMANGDMNDLHDVMITAKKASITLQTAVQVQRKALDAYNEVMRMQV